jgi:hypothetical protein
MIFIVKQNELLDYTSILPKNLIYKMVNKHITFQEIPCFKLCWLFEMQKLKFEHNCSNTKTW